MSQITADDWLAVWERRRANQNPSTEISPRKQLQLFAGHLAEIESRAVALVERIESNAIWIGASEPRSEAIASIRYAICRFDIAPNEFRPCYQAAIGGDVTLMRAAQALNHAKEKFQRFCIGADSQRLEIKRNSRRWMKFVYALQAELCKRPNLDYLVAYQQLPALSGLPELIAFNDEIARRTNRINKRALLTKLGRKSGPAVERDIERVTRTSVSESEFAIDGPARLGKYAHVRFDGVDAFGSSIRTIHTNLPVLFRLGRRRPSVTFPGEPGVRSYKNRSRPTGTICKDQFLETMPVRRYLRYADRNPIAGAG